jgi:bifunctional pyridoxal-dependent enzyme with beta-cystathionase and maltose regulon repressor activities
MKYGVAPLSGCSARQATAPSRNRYIMHAVCLISVPTTSYGTCYLQLCCLREIVEVKKKYGVYLFLDEAHSIGALGETGRGVCEKLNVPFDDVDILMGTFTKSFGSCGGYIAASAAVIQHLHSHCPAYLMVRASPVAKHIGPSQFAAHCLGSRSTTALESM